MKTTTQKTIEQLTKKGYYYVNSSITTANFPIPETVETEGYTILRFEKSFSSQEAIDRIKAEGLRPANIHELALLKENHPELWPKGKWSSLIAFGSTWTDAGGGLGVPRVDADVGGGFGFDLDRFAGDWSSSYALVAFCDNQPSDTLPLSESPQALNSLELTDELAISHLKKNGYKITKLIETEF